MRLFPVCFLSNESAPLIGSTFWKHSPPTVTPSSPPVSEPEVRPGFSPPSLPRASPAHGVQPHLVTRSQNTGVSCHALLQGIFSTQGSNTGLFHCRQILYCLSHHESPRIQEWVAYPFSREGRFFPERRISWATREAPGDQGNLGKLNHNNSYDQ